MRNLKIIKLLSISLLGASLITISSSIGANAKWIHNNKGYWYSENNSYVTGWKKIDGVWYLFDSNGYMKPGINKHGNTCYYFSFSNYKLLKNAHYKYLSTNKNGEVTKNNLDDAKNDVLYNDSEYIEELKKEYGNIEFSKSELTSVLDAINVGNSIFGIRNEDCIKFEIINRCNGKINHIGSYLVGLESGTIYSLSSKDRNKIYEVKNNNIVKSYLELKSSSEKDWR